MTEESEAESEHDIGIDLQPPDKIALESLIDNFGEELIVADVEEVVKSRVRDLYDNQDLIAAEIGESEQMAIGGQ